MKTLIKLFTCFTLLGSTYLTKASSCDSTCTNAGPNLLINSDFELGNTGFTSAYVYSTSAAMGNYGITQNTNLYVANQWCNSYDHTTGAGNYLWIDGNDTSQTIWSQTVFVNSNVDYSFSFWGMNLSVPFSGGISEFVDVYVNGIMVQSMIELNSADCVWIQKCISWNSGSASTAVIEIKNTNTHFMGNDLGFDDFSFKSCNEVVGCLSPGTNQVLNPDFELGNVDFTTDYIFANFASQGNYGITQNANLYVASQWCNKYDHTSGAGNYLWVDGNYISQTIWSQTMSVITNTDYTFSFWGINLSASYSGGTMEFVDVYINGVVVASNLDLDSADCFWQQYTSLWNSGSSTSAIIEIKNTNVHYMGNDLGFDDISFTSCNASNYACGSVCTGSSLNLLPNPGFESGNTGFTSGHTFATSAAQGNYGISPNVGMYVAGQWCNAFDHTNGAGNYMWVDASSVASTIWSQTVAVTANTNYSFSFWAMNLSIPFSGGTMEFVDVYINGTLAAAGLDLNAADCFWIQYCASWNSGSTTSATIEIKNTNTHYMGNDLAFDDLMFVSCSGGLGTSEIMANEIEVNVYPNPANNFITIENSRNEKLTIKLFDLAGKLLKSDKVFGLNKTIDINNVAEGMYMIHISNESNVSKTVKVQVIK